MKTKSKILIGSKHIYVYKKFRCTRDQTNDLGDLSNDFPLFIIQEGADIVYAEMNNIVLEFFFSV